MGTFRPKISQFLRGNFKTVGRIHGILSQNLQQVLAPGPVSVAIFETCVD